MGSYKNTEIDGNLSVGRKITAGGDLTVRGKATFGHDVKVDGWLEAPNIKDINKGIYLSYNDLLVHYPTPRDGWLAGVVETVSGVKQMTAYLAVEGQWVKQDYALEVDMDVEELVRLGAHLFVNVTRLMGLDEATTLSDVLTMIESMEETVAALYMVPGVVLTFLGEERWETWRWTGETAEDWDDETTWEDIDAATINNTITATAAELDAKIGLLASGLTLTLRASPTVVYKGEAATLTLTATMATSEEKTLSIYDGETKLGESSTSPYLLQTTATLTSNRKTYTAKGEVNGMTLNAEVSVEARYPIYSGFAAIKPTSGTGLTKRSATTSPAGTYQGTVSSGTNGVHFYILVPKDMQLTNFTMGGAPFVMTTYADQTVDGILYYIYESANIYNAGTTIKVTAS